MISIHQNSMKQTLHTYLFQYRKCFKKRSFDIFYWIVLSILCAEETRSIRFLYETLIKKYSNKVLNSLYYFLSYTKVPWEQIMLTTLRIALSIIPNEIKDAPIFLTIDDTLQAKFGKKFDCYGKLFDHTSRTGNAYLNGHCFVSLVVNIPLAHKGNLRYLSLPVGYKLYSKQKSKLQIASELINTAMEILQDYDVVVLCDSWYTKGAVLETIKFYDNLNLVGAVRSDTAIFDLPPTPNGKRGRPRLKGERLDIKTFEYKKVEDYYISTRKVITRLFKEPVYVTVTTKDIEAFASVRLFICTIQVENISPFKGYTVEHTKYDSSNIAQLPLCIYSIRWNIEVIFYQHKSFWSFGKYMVRSKQAIERYVNLLSIAYTFASVLPFLEQTYEQYQFKSPQVTKRLFSARIMKELILESFVSTVENSKIYSDVTKAVKSFLDYDHAV